MPITRSVWIDDDGSGTTGTVLNNTELQKIYNNIDGQIATGLWTPLDASGAGLTFTQGSPCRYWKYDKLVMLTAYIVYPSTSSSVRAQIGGLPYANGSAASGFYPFSATTALQFYMSPATQTIYVNSGTGGILNNVNLSGQGFAFTGVFLMA
jgi:hypothetical protein